MPFFIVQGDITEMQVDAIVNAANNSLLGGGGVDGCIHRAAGPELLKECASLNGCDTGDAKITGAYRLPCKHVIHTVGPIWRDGKHGEENLLTSCYERSLQLAVDNNCSSVAFPLISAGVYGYPKDQALRVASETIVGFLKDHELEIYLVIYNKSDFIPDRQRFEELGLLLDSEMASAALARAPIQQLDEALNHLDESFSQMLLRKIDEKGLTDVACYKKANLDRKLFSRIRSDAAYHPSKPTVAALILSLELTLDEAKEMLAKAGFALSRSNAFDVIIEYFITKRIYDVYEVNKALFCYDQRLLGSK
ncbi:MAG: O-acetyl-ADP-ribose deacetylase [bacterium]|nr:O-acetyl-ADP-ribose deacetylase [bacterium]